MATAPPAPPSGIGAADPEQLAKYNSAIDAQIKALDNRGNTNWFNIAAAFANPGRTGSFAEGFGNAMGVVGKQREVEEANAMPIAQMRASLASQQLGVANKQKAYGIFANAMGFQSPTDAVKALQTGNGLVGLSTKFTPELFSALSFLDKDTAETVKSAAGMDVERFKALIAAKQAGIDESKLYAMYGKEAVDYLNRNQGVIAGVSPNAVPTAGTPPAGTPATGTPATSTSAPQGKYDFSPLVDGGVLTSPVGQRNGTAHNGIDIGGMKIDAPVKSPVNGEVVFAGDSKGAAGIMVTVKDADGKLHSFMHLNSTGVAVGDKVDAATEIGGAGQTGNARGIHVHYEVKGADGKPVDPLNNFKVHSENAPIKTATEALGPVRDEGNRVLSPTGEVIAERGGATIAEWQDAKKTAIAQYNKERENTIAYEREQIKNAGTARSTSTADKVKEIGSINRNDLNSNLGRYDAVDAILNSDPLVKKWVGIMFKNNAGAQMYQLAKDGVRIGNFGLSIDAYNALVKEAPPAIQEKLRQIDMIFADIFAQKAKEAKSAFGPSISNFDIITQKEKMASTRDTAKIINDWITQERTNADYRLKLSEAYDDYLDKTEGTRKQPYQFFSTKEAKAIDATFAQRYKDLAITMHGVPK
jgi:murein DD-endopeptidase MepM/ murein hydrolase activator NlpD